MGNNVLGTCQGVLSCSFVCTEICFGDLANRRNRKGNSVFGVWLFLSSLFLYSSSSTYFSYFKGRLFSHLSLEPSFSLSPHAVNQSITSQSGNVTVDETICLFDNNRDFPRSFRPFNTSLAMHIPIIIIIG